MLGLVVVYYDARQQNLAIINSLVLQIGKRLVQRVNGYRFYELGFKLKPLSETQPEDLIKEAFFRLWDAREALLQIFLDLPLRICSSPASKVIFGIDSVIDRDFREAVKKFKSEEKVGTAAYQITEGAVEFATVLAAELPNLDTYLVSQKGTHSTPDLIERAEIMFPEPIRAGLPNHAIADIRQAGRCLALDNPTASAFHILRAIESVMAVYFEATTGRPLPTRMRNWSIYLKTLRKYPNHSSKAVNFLDHIRETYRNPILHPDATISEDEAESLLGVAASAMRMLVLETKAVRLKSESLPLLPPSAGTSTEVA